MKLNINDLRMHLAVDENRWPGRDGRYHADCPFCGKPHKPGQNHFSIYEYDGILAYKCHVCGKGGGLWGLFQHLGIASESGQKLTHYYYEDERGITLYMAIRSESGGKKRFWQQLPDGSKKIGNVRRVLYRLPEVLQAVAEGRRIWIVEGEKDVERLRAVGLVATTNVMGAGKWRDEYSKCLTGADIVIIPDNDKPGENHANQVATSLAGIAKSVRILNLPGLGEKQDVSDWLNMGGTVYQLKEMADALPPLPPLPPIEPPPAPPTPTRRRQTPTIEQDEQHILMQHPETGTPIRLPKGYSRQGHTIERWGRRTIYNGLISVISTGRNLHSRDEWVTIHWNGRGIHGTTTISRADMGSGEIIRKNLAAQGAAVHAKNASDVSAFLSDVVQENWETLPRITYVDRYGIIDDGLILPAGAIGIETPTYTGEKIEVGDDGTIYPSILREMEGWTQTILWLIFSIILASPAIARMKHDRNPVVYLGGQSGSGKTTAVQFALGLFGDPQRMTIQCGSGTTTRVGIQQSITRSHGMPVFLEDVHTMLGEVNQARKITGTIYDFANKPARSYGSLDQLGRGGETIGGTLMMAGEMLPEFIHAGQQNRTLTIDSGLHPPLGVPAKSAEGEKRANMLRAARSGYGLMGLSVCERIWTNWNAFINDVVNIQQHRSLAGQPSWGPLLAAAAVTLRIALIDAGMDLSYDLPLILMRDWIEIITSSQKQRDPATESYDKIILMLAQSRLVIHYDLPTWSFLEYRNTIVAGRLSSDRFWRVPTGGMFEQVVGPGQVFQHGRQWIDEGKIIAHRGQEPVSARIRVGRSLVRSLLIPENAVCFGENAGTAGT